MRQEENAIRKVDIASEGVLELDPGLLGDDIRELIVRCVAAQKDAARERYAEFVPAENALDMVSESELGKTLEKSEDIHGIATNPGISNVISFFSGYINGSVIDEKVEELRKNVDRSITCVLKAAFNNAEDLSVQRSGHLWYPKGAYMGWHTNSQAPGWRIYVNYAEEPGKSFFRYRDNRSGEIVTLMDKQWNIRLFKIIDQDPLWHAVYSDTNRFSFGYMVVQNSLARRLKDKLKRVSGRR